MRLFQCSGVYPSYRRRLDRLAAGATGFEGRVSMFLDDRFGACHFLEPVLRRDPSAFFTNADDNILQRRWALEAGMPANSALDDILLAQIEHHRTEVFYNMDPMRFQSAFLSRLPGCVRKSIAWRAAPSPGADFTAYSLVVCNFPAILASFEHAGCRTAYFSPAHDPVMDTYAANGERPIDLLFVGGYTRHHRRRAELLEAAASLAGRYSVAMHLDSSRLTRLSESIVGRLLPLAAHRRPRALQAVAQPPVFGRELYSALGSAKIVLNGAIDMAGSERGNMRCFEAMGCGSLLLSDEGDYPEGMTPDETLVSYGSVEDAVSKIDELLSARPHRETIARAGYRAMTTTYSKQRQWEQFVDLAQ